MKKLLRILLIAVLPAGGAWAAGGGVELEPARIDPDDLSSLQRGAKYFVNYCLSCHSASYHRYNRMAKDLELTDEQVSEFFIFTTDAAGEKTKVGALMEVAMTGDYAKEAFGAAPPNLALVSRSRGVDWLYNYLKGFYLDDARPLGVNNRVFPNVGMPHVMWDLQGWQRPVFREAGADAGGQEPVLERLELVQPGAMSVEEYDQVVRDMVNFLDYLGEPAKKQRLSLGVWVIAFLVVLFVITLLLKKEYWKDIH